MNYIANMMAQNPSFRMSVDSKGTYGIVDIDLADDDCDNTVHCAEVYLYPAGEPEGHWQLGWPFGG